MNPMTFRVSPRTLSGCLHSSNKGACDWGWQGFIAYGCQNLVVVLDPNTMQIIQTLEKHKGYIQKVKWAKENYYHDTANPYLPRLACSDHNGKIYIWDVMQAYLRSEFYENSKPIEEMQWLDEQEASKDLLLVLHPAASFVLWNAESGTKLWKKMYNETLHTFVLDPFDNGNVAFKGDNSIIFINDFSVSKIPTSNGKKFYISSSQNVPKDNDKAERKFVKSSSSITSKLSNILVGDLVGSNKKEEEELLQNIECLQLAYHKSVRNNLLLVYPREILILDLDINQTVGIISVERSATNFGLVIPLKLRDALYCLHDSGSISLRQRKGLMKTNFTDKDNGVYGTPVSETIESFPISLESQDLIYDVKASSESFRVTKHAKIYAISVCPITEYKICLIVSDGRILLLNLHNIVDGCFDIASSRIPKFTLADLIPPTFCDSDNEKTKFILSGMMNGLSITPLIIKMCPPLTIRNIHEHTPLLAVGSANGHIQVYNLSNGSLHREFNSHSCQVRGIEWLSLKKFLSYGCPNPNHNGFVKNEILVSDITTGRAVTFRNNRDEESPIDGIRVSHLKQYLVILFKDKPFELWDLKTEMMIRQMPSNFPKILSLEWNPNHHVRKKNVANDSDSSTDIAMSDSYGSSSKKLEADAVQKEHFLCSDTEGMLYHLVVDGNVVKEGSPITPDNSIHGITAISWKGDGMLIGDTEGNLSITDVKNRITRVVPTNKNWIKKLKFAPGKGNMKFLILYNDGVDLRDANMNSSSAMMDVLSSLKCPKDIVKIIDIDWAASDRPIVACDDGTVRIFDIKLKDASSSINDFILGEPIFSPYLLSPKSCFILKSLLRHQTWRCDYSLDLNCEEDLPPNVLESVKAIDDCVKIYFTKCKFGIAERALITSLLYGDEFEFTFWSVALHYLKRSFTHQSIENQSLLQTKEEFDKNKDIFKPTQNQSVETVDLFKLNRNNENINKFQSLLLEEFTEDTLESSYDVITDRVSFKKRELARAYLHDQKRTNVNSTRKCAENLLLLGKAERAVQLFLETDPVNDNYYSDCLRACLVASIRSSGASLSTIKLVATSLIANGKLLEGIQLLCLIDKGLDACRYLQTYGEWYKAAWLAKATLNESECDEVIRRWSEHLFSNSINQKIKGLLLSLSLGNFDVVLEMLITLRYFDTATIFIEACQQFGFLTTVNVKTRKAFEEYGKHLQSLGLKTASKYYSKN